MHNEADPSHGQNFSRKARAATTKNHESGKIITIYRRVRSGNTRNNAADPLHELLTCMSWATCMAVRDTDFLDALSHDKDFFLMADVWAQCDRRCGARRAVHRRRVIRGHAVLRNYSARYSPVRNRSASDSRQLRPDSFFRYCLGLRGGGSSHFAPICTAKLRRDQSSGGGGWDKCTECHINHGHRGLSPSLPLSVSLSVSLSLSLSLTHTHTHSLSLSLC